MVVYRPSSLKINFIWAFVGNAISSACMFLLLVIVSKQGDAAMVGVFTVAQAVGLPVNMLLSLKLQNVQVTDARNEFSFGHYYAVRILTSISTTAVITAIAVLFYAGQTAWIIILMGMGYSVISLRESYLSVMQKSEQMNKMTVSMILQASLSLVMFGGIFLWTHNLVFSVVGLIMARLGTLLLYDRPTALHLLRTNPQRHGTDRLYAVWDGPKLWTLVKLAAPLGLVAWLVSLYTSIPRLTLDKYYGQDEVGYFGAISSLLVLGTMITTALGQTVSPRLSRYYVENIIAYKLLVYKMAGIALCLGLLAVAASTFLGRWILTVMFTSEYAQYNHIFVGLTVAGAILFLYTFMNDSLTATRTFTVQLPICAAAAGVCGLGSLVLIPRVGMMGAVYALIGCYLVGFLGCLVSVIYFYRRRKAIISVSR